VNRAHALEDAGCSALAIHARTRIAEVKRLGLKMPIIGNGDVDESRKRLRR